MIALTINPPANTSANACFVVSGASSVDISGDRCLALRYRPSVTMNTGTRALVIVNVTMNPPLSAGANVCPIVTGATNRAFHLEDCMGFQNGGNNSNGLIRGSAYAVMTDLNPGNNTFTMQYNSSTGFATTFSARAIHVISLG